MIDLNSPWRKGRPKWGPAQLTKNILSQDRHSLGKPQNRQRGEMGKTALSCCSLLIRLQKPSKNSPCMYLPQFTRCKTVRHNRISFIFLFIHWSSLNAILKSIENVTFVNHYPVHSYGKLVKYFYFIFFFFGHSMWDISSPTRDRTYSLCTGSSESYPLDPQGSPLLSASVSLVFLDSIYKSERCPQLSHFWPWSGSYIFPAPSLGTSQFLGSLTCF